jgi:hypothetical protein
VSASLEQVSTSGGENAKRTGVRAEREAGRKRDRVSHNEVFELKRTHRAEIDELKLEIEALKVLLAQSQADFNERFRAVKETVRLELSPE